MKSKMASDFYGVACQGRVVFKGSKKIAERERKARKARAGECFVFFDISRTYSIGDSYPKSPPSIVAEMMHKAVQSWADTQKSSL